MIRIIITFFFFLMISTFLFWLHVAKQQEAYIKNLISENLKNKFNATYSLKTTGYPNRVDTTVSDIIHIINRTSNKY